MTFKVFLVCSCILWRMGKRDSGLHQKTKLVAPKTKKRIAAKYAMLKERAEKKAGKK